MPSAISSTLRWNSASASRGVRAEDAVDPAGVETEAPEVPLELGDVVAPEVGGAQVERAIPEAPAGLDQRGPGHVVADAVGVQPPGPLERRRRVAAVSWQ